MFGGSNNINQEPLDCKTLDFAYKFTSSIQTEEYLITVTDDYNRFPFAFPFLETTTNVSCQTYINLNTLLFQQFEYLSFDLLSLFVSPELETI